MDVKKKRTVVEHKPRTYSDGVMEVTVAGKSILSAARVKRACARMLKKAGVEQGVLSVIFLAAQDMRVLNRKALGHDHVTDVITFDLSGGAVGGMTKIDAEIYVCPEEAKRNAVCFKEPEARELLRYLAHGILHLSGLDDATDRQREIMRAEEDLLLGDAGR